MAIKTIKVLRIPASLSDTQMLSIKAEIETILSFEYYKDLLKNILQGIMGVNKNLYSLF